MQKQKAEKEQVLAGNNKLQSPGLYRGGDPAVTCAMFQPSYSGSGRSHMKNQTLAHARGF